MDLNLLEQYAIETGETGTLYSIPSGAMGNDTGVAIEVVIPNNLDNITGLYGQINSDAKDSWTGIESTLLNNNSSAITVRLSECNGSITSETARIETAELNLKILDVVGNIVGIDEAKVMGASNGSAIAIETAAVSVSNGENHSVSVTGVAYLDYANPNGIDFTSSLETMAKGGVTLTGITDTDYSLKTGTGGVVSEYSKLGGNAETYLYGSGYSHDNKCEQGSLGFMGLDNNFEFIEHRTYNNGEETIEEYNSKIINSKETTTYNISLYQEIKKVFTGNGQIVESNLDFTKENMERLGTIINRMSILSAATNAPVDNGMATFDEISNIYNTYINNSQALLGNVTTSFLNIISIATSLKELDAALSYDIAKVITNNMANLDIDIKANANNFNFSTNEINQGKDIKLSRDTLDEALSGNNMIINTMLKDMEETRILQSEMEKFIEESKNILQGPGWDAVRGKLGNYCVTLNAKNDYVEEAITEFNDSYNNLLNYIEDITLLDTSQIPQVEQSIRDLENQIESLIALRAALVAEHGKTYCNSWDDKGNCTSHYTVDNTAKIASTNQSIELATNLKKECVRLLDKLNKIHSKDTEIGKRLLRLRYRIQDVFKKLD